MARNKTPNARGHAADIAGDKLRVFVSYSRRDAAVADQIAAELAQRGFEPVIDRRDLPYGEQWQSELAGLIQSSDTVVWLVSVASVASAWVNWELGQVARASKRLIPVRIEEVSPESLPQSIGRIHLLPAEGVFDPERHFPDLAATLDSDRGWIRQHTRLADRAAEWKAEGSTPDLLLRGAALKDAEDWRIRQPAKAPLPSAEIQELLAASERAGKRRARRLLAVTTLISVGSVALALTAMAQYFLAEAARVEATKQRDSAFLNESRLIAEKADQRLREQDPIGALADVRPALPRDVTAPDRPMSDEAMLVLSSAVYAASDNPFRRFSYTTRQALAPRDRLLFSRSSDGRYLAFASEAGLEAWDIAGQRRILNQLAWKNEASIVRGMDVSRSGTVAWSHNGKFLLARSGNDWGAISIFAMPSGEQSRLAIAECPQEGKLRGALSMEEDRQCRIQDAAWSPDDNLVAVSVYGGKIHVFDLRNPAETKRVDIPCGTIEDQEDGRCSALNLSWSSDGKLLGSQNSDGAFRVLDWRSNTEIFKRPQVSRGEFESEGLWIEDTQGAYELLTGPTFETAAEPDFGIAAPSGDRIAEFVDGAVEIRPLSGNAPVIRIPDVAPSDRLSWSPDGAFLAATYGATVVVFDAKAGKRLFRLGDTSIKVSDFAWTVRPAEFVIAYCQLGSCSTWEVADMKVESDPALLLDAADRLIRASKPQN